MNSGIAVVTSLPAVGFELAQNVLSLKQAGGV